MIVKKNAQFFCNYRLFKRRFRIILIFRDPQILSYSYYILMLQKRNGYLKLIFSYFIFKIQCIFQRKRSYEIEILIGKEK